MPVQRLPKAMFMAFLGYNFYGWLSDRTGRKKILSSTMRPSNAICGWQFSAQVVQRLCVVPPHLCERFPKRALAWLPSRERTGLLYQGDCECSASFEICP
jgi:MFS family permease